MLIKLSIVMPCLNEAETLALCIKKARTFLEKSVINGEIIVSDNGSTDGSLEIAVDEGARLVETSIKGYGSALRKGIEAARGEYIIIGDSDDSHDLENLEQFIEKLDQGFDMVIGNRFLGEGIKKGDMPFLHRYLGNPVLSFIGKVFFNSKIGDFHCGLRGFTKSSYDRLHITTTGMEFASELIVKAELANLNLTEVATKVFPSGRSRNAHLRTWQDGWRHLRFLLLYSPKWLFLLPGVFVFFFGLIISGILVFSELETNTVFFNVTNLLYSSGLVLIGFQFIVFYVLIKIFAVSNGLLPASGRYYTVFKILNLEKGLLAGFIIFILGGITAFSTLFELPGIVDKTDVSIFKNAIIAICFMLIGIQVILFSFFFSILGLTDENNDKKI